MTTLAVESLASILKSDEARIEKLIDAHWSEVAKYKHVMKLAPDMDRYLRLEKADLLHVVIMRDDDRRIVGYSVHFIVVAHPHYQHLMTAEDDVHYLVPELRGTGAHEEMRRFALKTLKDHGVQIVTARMKVDHPHDASLRRMGYVPFDMVYTINLTE